MTSYDAVVLAGGRAARLGGVDKPGLCVGGVSMLDRVLNAVASAQRRIVVGPVEAPALADIVTCEDPPGGGPVAAAAAGLKHVDASLVVILAADLPFLTSSTVDGLVGAVRPDVDGALLVDDAGRDQLLIAAWRTRALRERLTAIGDPAGQSVRRLYVAAALVRMTVTTEPGRPPPWLDCDTDADLRRAREWT